MKDKLPTAKQLYKRSIYLQTHMGFGVMESFEDVVGDLLAMCKAYQDAAKGWMKEYDKLKNKYEPMVLEASATTPQE